MGGGVGGVAEGSFLVGGSERESRGATSHLLLAVVVAIVVPNKKTPNALANVVKKK